MSPQKTYQPIQQASQAEQLVTGMDNFKVNPPKHN